MKKGGRESVKEGKGEKGGRRSVKEGRKRREMECKEGKG